MRAACFLEPVGAVNGPAVGWAWWGGGGASARLLGGGGGDGVVVAGELELEQAGVSAAGGEELVV